MTGRTQRGVDCGGVDSIRESRWFSNNRSTSRNFADAASSPISPAHKIPHPTKDSHFCQGGFSAGTYSCVPGVSCCAGSGSCIQVPCFLLRSWTVSDTSRTTPIITDHSKIKCQRSQYSLWQINEAESASIRRMEKFHNLMIALALATGVIYFSITIGWMLFKR